MTDASRARSATRSVIWYASVCMPLPAVTRMAMMRVDWEPTRSRSCCAVGTRFVARTWPRSRLSRASRTRSIERITIDLDPTDDPTHGAQQLTFFNGHYDTWCYLPVAGFLTFNEEAEQYLFAYVLRPGNATASVGAIGILSRLLPRLRAAFPLARLRVRLDGGFAAPELFAFLARKGLQYVVAMGKNKVLERRAARLMGTAPPLSRKSGETAP